MPTLHVGIAGHLSSLWSQKRKLNINQVFKEVYKFKQILFSQQKNIDYLKAFKMGFLVLIPLLGVVRVHYAMDKPDDLQNVIIATGLSLTSIFGKYT